MSAGSLSPASRRNITVQPNLLKWRLLRQTIEYLLVSTEVNKLMVSNKLLGKTAWYLLPVTQSVSGKQTEYNTVPQRRESLHGND